MVPELLFRVYPSKNILLGQLFHSLSDQERIGSLII